MKLYLVQHGKSCTKEQDPVRPLTVEGKAEAEQVSDYIRSVNISVNEIWHSGKERALQTANILAKAIITEKDILEHEGLNPNDDVSVIASQINNLDTDLMIVGHLPFLSKLASFLILGSESMGVIAFQNTGVVCLLRDEQSQWNIEWVVVPGLITQCD